MGETYEQELQHQNEELQQRNLMLNKEIEKLKKQNEDLKVINQSLTNDIIELKGYARGMEKVLSLINPKYCGF